MTTTTPSRVSKDKGKAAEAIMNEETPYRRTTKKCRLENTITPLKAQRLRLLEYEGENKDLIETNRYLQSTINELQSNCSVLLSQFNTLRQQYQQTIEAQQEQITVSNAKYWAGWNEDDFKERETALSDLRGKKGRVVSVAEAKLIRCRLFTYLQNHKTTVTVACILVGQNLKVGSNLIQRLYKNYTIDQQMNFTSQSRGKESSVYQYKDSPIDSNILREVGAPILGGNQDGEVSSTLDVQKYLEENHAILLSRSAISRILKTQLSFAWGPVKKVSRAMLNPKYKTEHIDKQKAYLINYSRALQNRWRNRVKLF